MVGLPQPDTVVLVCGQRLFPTSQAPGWFPLSPLSPVWLRAFSHLSCSHHAPQCPVRACPAHHCLGLQSFSRLTLEQSNPFALRLHIRHAAAWDRGLPPRLPPSSRLPSHSARGHHPPDRQAGKCQWLPLSPDHILTYSHTSTWGAGEGAGGREAQHPEGRDKTQPLSLPVSCWYPPGRSKLWPATRAGGARHLSVKGRWALL